MKNIYDYLSRRRRYKYWRKRQKFEMGTKLNESLGHEIWTEGKSKKYRKAAALVDQALDSLRDEVIPPIVIVDGRKFHAPSAYNPNEDVIFVNNQLESEDKVKAILSDHYFASRNLTGILKHEIGHRLHWLAAKRYYFAHESRYNDIKDAKHDLDARVEKIIKNEINLDKDMFVSLLGQYAFDTFKDNHEINDVIAEFCVKEKLPSKYKYLENDIKEMLSYGQDGYHGITK